MTIMPLFMRDPWLEACWPPLAALLPRSRKHSNVKENTRQAMNEAEEMEEEGCRTSSLLALWWGASHTAPHPPSLRQEIDRSAASQTNKCLLPHLRKHSTTTTTTTT